MKHATLALIFSTFAAATLSAQDSPDPSYEPARQYGRPTQSGQPSSQRTPATITITENAPGPHVKYILDGKPVYDGPMPVAESARRDPPSSNARVNIEAPAPFSTEPAIADPDAKAPQQTSSSRPIQTQSARVAGRGRYTPPQDSVSVDVQIAPSTAPAPLDPPAYPRAPYSDPNDLTADKPGSVAAVNPNLLEEMISVGEVSSRAKRCYRILAEIKTNIETTSRCLDNRGKENARLVHTSEELSKNISDMAAIWPRNDDFRDRCASLKRMAVLFNDELNQTPWQWAQVRWGFDGILKNVVGFRDYARNLADAEPKPIAIVDKKTGQVTYRDAPDPLMTTPDALHAARQQATHEEIAKYRRMSETLAESKKSENDKVKIDLDGK